MSKDRLIRLINTKQTKMDELVKRSEGSENIEELRSLNGEMEELKKELDELRFMVEEVNADEQRTEQIAQKKTIMATYGVKTGSTETETKREQTQNDYELRATTLKENGTVQLDPFELRSVTIASGELASPTQVQGTINDKFNEVSSIVDLVSVSDARGLDEYQVPYVVGYGEGGIKGEGADYTESDPVFNYAVIKPIKITIYTEVGKEVTKLTNVQYFAKVQQAALIALRKKVAKLIPLGNPSATPAEITGIKNASALTSGALGFTAIDDKSLRKIAFNYGGDENVQGNAILQLNKNDLIAFGDVRGTSDKKPVYEITPDPSNPNSGIIKDGGLSVRYIINSALPALSTAGTLANTLCMIYGVPAAYELALFSPYSIEVSTEAAFKKGMLAIRGDVLVGGNVVVSNGFLLINKVTA